MTATTPLITGTTLAVLPWPDPEDPAWGHDPRDTYVERFWLGILGPSTVWLLRRFADGFDHWPSGYEIDLLETAAALGLAPSTSRNSPLGRTLQRCCTFDLASPHRWGLSVRRRLPSLSAHHLQRLPTSLQSAHHDWRTERRTPATSSGG
jgi:hypothetical protein